MKCKLAITLTFALLAVSVADLSAQTRGSGYFLKGGIGYSPIARTSTRVTGDKFNTSGFAPSVVVGYLWNNKHAFEIRWQTTFLNNSDGLNQGTIGVSYTHHFQKLRGPSPFLTIGIGMQHGAFPPSVGASAETDDGAAFILSGGLKIGARAEVAMDYVRGSTNKFFTNNENYDFSHSQLTLSFRYTLLGFAGDEYVY